MGRLRIFQSDLTNALEDHSYDHRWMLDLQTGEVFFMPGEYAGLEDFYSVTCER